MDLALIRELFTHCIEAERILGVDGDYGVKLGEAMKKLPPYRIGSNGFVEEWIEDWTPGPEGHNVSPLYPFFPGNDITLRGNPDLAAAYQKWMEAHATPNGFQLAWSVAMWARLEHGDKAGALIRRFISRSPADNLHNRGGNQSDASFGTDGRHCRDPPAKPRRGNQPVARVAVPMARRLSERTARPRRIRGGHDLARRKAGGSHDSFTQWRFDQSSLRFGHP